MTVRLLFPRRYLVSIQKWTGTMGTLAKLVEIAARGKFNRQRSCPCEAGIWLIFRGLNFLRNKDIGQIGHFWIDTIYDGGPAGSRSMMVTSGGASTRKGGPHEPDPRLTCTRLASDT
jgi:hypothetical protein